MLKSSLAAGTDPMAVNPVSAVTEGNVCVSAATFTPTTTSPGTPWSFELQRTGAKDWRSLTGTDIGDVLLVVSYDVSGA
jgi:hypothetical protein